MRSMTGYGISNITMYERTISIEIKSVNHRYNEIKLFVPRIISCLEDKIKSIVQTSVYRGRTEVYVHIDSASANDISVEINEPLADCLMAAFYALKERYHLSSNEMLPIITSFKDVITISSTNNAEIINQIQETIEHGLQIALSQFTAMKLSEGERLKIDILSKINELQQLMISIKEQAPVVSDNYAKRLKMRISEALSGIAYDETRLIQEVAIFTDKSCIYEELTRLDSHFIQFIDIANKDEVAGKKLDFLMQEINREINTIGSKANDTLISKFVIEMKSIAEMIREQVQNIE